jgi:hypothetical protein
MTGKCQSLGLLFVLFIIYWCLGASAKTKSTCKFKGYGTGEERIHVNTGDTVLLYSIDTNINDPGVWVYFQVSTASFFASLYDIILSTPNANPYESFKDTIGHDFWFYWVLPKAYSVYIRNNNLLYGIDVTGFVYWNHESPVTTTSPPSPSPPPFTTSKPHTTTTTAPIVTTQESCVPPFKDIDTKLTIAIPCGIIEVLIVCSLIVMTVVMVKRRM